jgi:hypothetical protein
MALVSAFAAVCEKILIERDNVTSLIRMADMFTVMPNVPRLPDGSLPAVPMQLYITLRFTHDDADEHEVSFKLVRPNGNEKVQAIDLTPWIRPDRNTIWTKERGRTDESEQAHGGADDRCAEAG